MQITIKQISEQFTAPSVKTHVAHLEITTEILGESVTIMRLVELTPAQIEQLQTLHAEIVAGVQS